MLCKLSESHMTTGCVADPVMGSRGCGVRTVLRLLLIFAFFWPSGSANVFAALRQPHATIDRNLAYRAALDRRHLSYLKHLHRSRPIPLVAPVLHTCATLSERRSGN